MHETRLMVLDPGHFHAALMQNEMYLGISRKVLVYAPLGPEVLDYLNRVALFNSRGQNPTAWEIDLHTGPDFQQRMLRERPGNAVVLTGRNRPKMDRILASLEAGLNVLADKPWIIASADMPKLEEALSLADSKGLIAYDIMTERFEITSILQRELVNDAEVFGTLVPGSAAEPAVTARSIHHLMKVVAGVPLRRPAWFFDVDEYGEGLADVGTHVVDLVQWTAFPHDKLDCRTDVSVLAGRRWPTVLSRADFERVTGEALPDGQDQLDYYCNNFVHYTVRGIHVKLDILWNWEGAGDVYEAAFRGTNARIEIRQGAAEKFVPELYIVPGKEGVIESLKRKVEQLQTVYPGLGVEESGDAARIVIPARLRVGHEAHFAQVTSRFFDYLRAPETLPDWEMPNMLVKYYITTRGVELSRG